MRPPIHIRLIRSLATVADRAGEAFSWLIRPFEGAIGWLFGRTMAASESADRLDAVVSWLFRLLLAPLRGLVWLSGKVVPESIRTGVGDVGARLWFALVAAAIAIVEWLNLDVLFHWLAWLAAHRSPTG